MPSSRAPTPCSKQGCPQLLERGEPHPGCPLELDDDCPSDPAARKRKADRRRPSARNRGYTTEWDRAAKKHLKSHPWCTEPGCRERATDVDHIDGLGPHGPRGLDPTNFRSFCHPHHSKRTARDQPGGWHAAGPGGGV